MVVLACVCLNVKIDIKREKLVEAIPSRFAEDTELKDDPFFKLKLAHLNLNEHAVVKIAQDWLIQRRQIGTWVISKCINCNILTHAEGCEPAAQRLFLINLDLQSGADHVRNLMTDVNYSPIYKVVILGNNFQNQENSSLYMHTHFSQQTLPKLEDLANEYLNEEKVAMDEKIRKFVEVEQLRYYELEQKAHRDKHRMIELLMTYQDRENEFGLATDPFSASFSPGVRREGAFHAMSANDSVTGPSGYLRQQQSYNLDTSSSGNVQDNSHKASTNWDQDSLLFIMDPAGDEPETSTPHVYLEDPMMMIHDHDISDPDTPMSSNTDAVEHTAFPTSMQYSTSVPIAVPTSHRAGLPVVTESSDDMPSDIGASIKALARSVHGDTSEIFGDLPRAPRPRIQSSDYTIAE